MNAIESRILIYAKDGSSLKPIKIYRDSEGRKWVESRNGTKFVIEVKNNTYDTYLAVISVDGLNVINAKRAELKAESGYIINPYAPVKVNGWRTSLDSIREFVFTNKKDKSFSHKLGADESNTGVIGVALFKKKVINFWPASIYSTLSSSVKYNSTSDNEPEYFNCSCSVDNITTSSAYNASSIPPASNTILRSAVTNMATAQGDSKLDKVSEVTMEFESAVSITDTIYYDSRENLISKGIIKEEKSSNNKLPQPFNNSGFCPDLN